MFSNRALVKADPEAPKRFKYSVFEASKLILAKTRLLKRTYRRQRIIDILQVVIFGRTVKSPQRGPAARGPAS